MSNPLTKLASRVAHVDPTQREIFFASLFLLLWFLIGTLGYSAIEGWSLMDGLFMSFITLTTIGFSEIQPLTTPGRLFTIFIAFVGIGLVAFVAARAAQALLAGQILSQRQMMHKIKHIRDHYIICGFGRIGKRVATDLQHAGQAFVVIERSEDLVKTMHEEGILALVGDAEEEATLQKAGIEQARGLITVLPEDSTNIFVTLVARELQPHLFILARTSTSKNRRKLFQAGATEVVAPSDVGADRMAQVILRPSVDRFMAQVMKADDLGLMMEEVPVHPRASLAGKTLAQARFRQQFDAIVIGIIKGQSDVLTFNPGPRDAIESGDTLIVLGSQEMIRRLRHEGCMAA